MLKLSKKADYGLIAVKHLATRGVEAAQSAADIAEVYGISATLLAKVLQKLARSGLVTAQHGSAGGYRLARDPSEISALDVISAVDGPVFITSCTTTRGECFQSPKCTVREPLRRVNESIMQVLSTVTISQMSDEPEQPTFVALQS
ncbi:MAG: SUF system Fe-S cluster assembly regulator [Candidatus Acidiferrales bacterium]